MQIALFVLALVLAIGLIVIHELGHLLSARANGVVVEEFGLGFPPRIYSKKTKSGMRLSLNWLLLGGFVKLRGEHDSDTRPGSFGASTLAAKIKIMLAGVGMNLAAGLVLLSVVALIGMPVLITKDNTGQDQFTVASNTHVIRQEVAAGYIQPGSPAKAVGLRSTDIIISIQSGQTIRSIKTPKQLHSATTEFAGQKVQLTYSRSGQVTTKTVQLRSQAEVKASQNSSSPKGYLGVEPNTLIIRRSTWSAPIVALGFAKQLLVLTAQGIGHAIGGLASTLAGIFTNNHVARENGQAQASGQVGGPVAIGQILWSSGSLGLNFVLMFIAIISLTLAFFNLLPIPALDGGRLAMTIIWRGILKRPISREAEERAISYGVNLLILLIILITIVDVKRAL